MKIDIHSHIDDVEADAWNALIRSDNPFVEHRFLSLLESSHSVGAGTGWEPRHVVVRDGARVVGAAPTYLRHDSYGEFIFDWGWAQAAQRARIPYYPKVTCAVPFTPATGPRLLTANDSPKVRDLLCVALQDLAKREQASSVHILFCRDDEAAHAASTGYQRRASMQFHWRNAGWKDFDAFLQSLRHEERKQIRRERRRVAEAGVRIELRLARDMDRTLLPQVFRLYTSTSDRKWGRPYLTEDFFHALPDVLGDAALFGLAFREEKLIAMTLSFEKRSQLYGRHWGACEEIPGLHFELCYYAHIERAISQRMVLFEAGAQGEHKLKRGFLPVQTHSAHEIFHPGLSAAVKRFIVDERVSVTAEQQELLAHSPFRGPSPEGVDDDAGENAMPKRPLVAGVDDL